MRAGEEAPGRGAAQSAEICGEGACWPEKALALAGVALEGGHKALLLLAFVFKETVAPAGEVCKALM